MHEKSLRQFLQLAELRHFGRAADACHVSASTLSRSISRLEASLGVRLMERDNRRVVLTAAGERLRAWSRETLQSWEQLRSGLLDSSGELTGEISIYGSVTASYSFLYELLTEFRARHPRVQIKLHTGDPDQAMTRVLSGEEALALGARPNRLPAGLEFREVARSPLLLIGPAGSALAPSLKNQPMIVSERGVLRDRVEQWFEARGMRATIAAQVAGNEAIVSMVSLGGGIGVVPKIVLDNSPLAGQVKVLRARPPLDDISIGLFALRRRLDQPLVRALWETPATGSNGPGRGTLRS